MTMDVSSVWRRLDAPGHDACRVVVGEDGWQLHGTAVFVHGGAAACLAYDLQGDRAWRTRRGAVKGFIGDVDVNVVVVRTEDGIWRINDIDAQGLSDCVHLDFAFTPATNFPHLRQLGLCDGESAELPVAWLDLPCDALQRLPQRYERRSATTYWYEAPSVGYAALLEFTSSGLVHNYPGLWTREDIMVAEEAPDRRHAP